MSNEGLNMYQTEKETQYSVPAQARKLELEKKTFDFKLGLLSSKF